LTARFGATNLLLPARLTTRRETSQDLPVMIVTFTSTRIDVPITGAWAIATDVANPRMSVDSNHTGAGSRA